MCVKGERFEPVDYWYWRKHGESPVNAIGMARAEKFASDHNLVIYFLDDEGDSMGYDCDCTDPIHSHRYYSGSDYRSEYWSTKDGWNSDNWHAYGDREKQNFGMHHVSTAEYYVAVAPENEAAYLDPSCHFAGIGGIAAAEADSAHSARYWLASLIYENFEDVVKNYVTWKLGGGNGTRS